MLPVYSLASHGKHTCMHTKAHRHTAERRVCLQLVLTGRKNVYVCVFMHQGREVRPAEISGKVSNSKQFNQCEQIQLT